MSCGFKKVLIALNILALLIVFTGAVLASIYVVRPYWRAKCERDKLSEMLKSVGMELFPTAIVPPFLIDIPKEPDVYGTQYSILNQNDATSFSLSCADDGLQNYSLSIVNPMCFFIARVEPEHKTLTETILYVNGAIIKLPIPEILPRLSRGESVDLLQYTTIMKKP